jgi:ribosomal protein S18 acetylase RimI-like enzyme
MAKKLVEIREATRSDAGGIARVHDEAWRATYQGIIPHLHLERMIVRRSPAWWARSLSRRRSRMLVLTFNGIVQGYTSFGTARNQRRSKTGEIFELYLAPTFQGLGLGKKLFMAARQALTRQGSRSLLVWALADNEGACDFYSRLGGRRCATSAETYGDVSLSRVAFYWESVDRPTR